MSADGTTEVSKEELAKKFLPTYVNAPTDLDQARDRILSLEMGLEDMARAVEIAQITGNWEILDQFRQSAEHMLETKIQIVQPSHDLELNVLVDDRDSGKARDA